MKNNGWKSYLCLEIMEKNEQICTVKFQNFLGAMTQTPILGRGYGAPPQIPLWHTQKFSYVNSLFWFAVALYISLVTCSVLVLAAMLHG